MVTILPEANVPQEGGVRSMAYFKSKRLISARVHEFEIIDKFKYGYRNREDQTNLPAGVLVVGSQNILTNVSERIQCRKGYALDGPVSTTIAPIDSANTYLNHLGVENNLRTYLPSAGTGKMEYRYVNSAGTVTWRTLLSSLTATKFNYATFFDTTENQRVLLMVNGLQQIWEWNGAITTIASVTANTITTNGTTTWGGLGFYSSNSPRKITINGTDYTYTGGESTTTLTGVTPNPVAGVNANDIAHQTPIVTASGSLAGLTTGIPTYDLIANFRNQIYVGCFTNQQIYMSKVSNYKDYSFTSPVRLVGEGDIFLLDSPPVGFAVLDNLITISAAKNQWYQLAFALSSDLTKETVTVNRLKTTANQSAQSQALISAMKNDVIFVSNEPTLDRLGKVEQILGTTQTTNISDSIKLDFDNYNFTDASIFYNKYFIYLAIPKNGVLLIYNIVESYWEAPQTIPIGKFYTVAGVLYGHSYLTPESYKLFTGRADRVDPTTNPLGNPIPCTVVFSFQNYASPFTLKNFNKFYVEGYIASNTNLTLGITYDMNGCSTNTSYSISGTGSYVCIGTGQEPTDDQSLGKHALGKYPLGGNLTQNSSNALPPKFRIIRTFPSTDFHEVQYSFSSSQTDSNWEILRFGPALEYSSNIPVSITV